MLNEKLENDLLSMNKHHGGEATNGDGTPLEASDVLAGLELGKKSVSEVDCTA